MSSILVYHHLGLGDHIICHGIIREYCKKFQRVGLFCLPHNYASVSFMFRDLANLSIIVNDNFGAKTFIKKNQTTKEFQKTIIIGFKNLSRTSREPLEKQFYKLAGVSFEKKWENFFVKRDHEREVDMLKKSGVESQYAFIHEDASRGYIIDRGKISKNLHIFSSDRSATENIFDYCSIIEKAKEIHLIDSSFMFLVEHLNYINPHQKLFIHRYTRENPNWKLPILKKDWQIIRWRSLSDMIRHFVLFSPVFKIVKFFARKLIPKGMLQNNRNRALFLDRDGVICEAMEHGKDVTKLEEFILMPGISDVVSTAKNMGYKIVVVTNQSVLAKGVINAQMLQAIHDKMQDLLENQIDKIYYCLHAKTENCQCRKPKPGMLLRATDDLNIDPTKSILIGDKESDILAGQVVGCKTIFLDSPIHGHRISMCKPDVKIKHLSEILMFL